MKQCSIEGCLRAVRCKQLCSVHYDRKRKHGDPHFTTYIANDDVARFWSKVDKSNECWLWLTATNLNGYGRFRLNGKTRLAHRVAYEFVVGEIPEGLQLDHLCRVRLCVNPAHLEPVTCLKNNHRGLSGVSNRSKTHCPQGHAYDSSNTYVDKLNRRYCKACRKARMKEWHASH